MSRKPLSLLVMIFSGLLFIGCNRGCTTSKTIASESKTVATKGGNAQVVGRVVDYRHSRRVGDNIFDRSVTHSYGLTFDFKFGTFVEKSFFHQGVDNPDAVQLGKELKRVDVAISNDKNHVGLGVDGKVVELIHLYKSNRISTQEVDWNADGTMDWSSLKINSYPSPEEMLTESLKNSCDAMVGTNNAVYEYCNSSKPSAKIQKIMLDKWPDCSAAKGYLTQQKVRQLKQDAKWRKWAEKRGEKVLAKIEYHSFDIDEILLFIDALGSQKLSAELEEVLIKNWGRSGMPDYTELLVNKIKHKKTPLSKDGRKAVYDQAKSEFTKFMKTGESDRKHAAIDCIQLLSALGDTLPGYQFVQNAFGQNVQRFDQFDFLDVAYDDFNVFTDYQQRVIMEETEGTFEHFKDYSRSSYFYAIEDLVDCSMLKRLKTKYPEDLKSPRVPTRCGP
ncbi:MAG: hypothetical protein AB8B56_01140 [Crocinitomicaceae bacterium]